MGIGTNKNKLIIFTDEIIKNKNLIIEMLKYEDSLILGDIGKQIYEEDSSLSTCSLFPEYTLHRLTLAKFGFNTSDDSVETYRKIFKYYYKSSTDYDNDVLSSVTYMRQNRCLYYKEPIIEIGDTLPNCELYNLDGKTKSTIYDIFSKEPFNYGIIGGFSSS